MANNELHPGIVYAVLMLDELVHTNEKPFCDDLTCPCHSDVQLDHEYLAQPWQDGLLTTDETVRLWAGKQV